MVELLNAFKHNYGMFSILVSIVTGNGFYNLHQSYKISHYSQSNEQILTERSKWFLHKGRIMLLISILFLTLLCCIALLLHIQGQTIFVLVISTMVISPLYTIMYIFLYRKGEIDE